MSASAYYRPSLRIPLPGQLRVLAAGLAGLASAWCYAWATSQFTPLLHPLLTAVMACWLAVLAIVAASAGKIRHPAWMGWAGTAIGLLAWYAQWTAWIVFEERHVPGLEPGGSSLLAAYDLFWRPDLVAAGALDVLKDSDSLPGKAFRIAMWAVELLAFVLLPKATAAQRASLPFCEETQEWAERIVVPQRFAFIDDPEATRRRLEQDPAALRTIVGPPIDPGSPRFAELTLYRCGGKASFVTINNLDELAPQEVPLPREARSESAEYFAQEDEPVVELLRFPLHYPDQLLSRWAEEERALQVRQALARESAAEAADKWTRE